MVRKTTLAVVLGVGLLAGFAARAIPGSESAHAQQSDQLFVKGHGRAISSVGPPGEQFTLIPSDSQRAFKVVPPGKGFVLTDVMYIAQGSVRQNLTVNIADANPGNQTHDILFQVRISPGESDQVHLCSGYVIPPGHAVVGFTNAGVEPEQYVSVSVTGYLTTD